MVYSLLIEGFHSKAEVETFIKWYEGQGEQSAEIWFEEAQARGIIERDFIPVDCKKTYPIKFEDKVGKMYVE